MLKYSAFALHKRSVRYIGKMVSKVKIFGKWHEMEYIQQHFNPDKKQILGTQQKTLFGRFFVVVGLLLLGQTHSFPHFLVC